MNETNLINTIYQTVSFIDAILSIFAAGIVIYIFISKRKSILSIYHMLLNYSFQTSLNELEINLNRLNDFNADDEKDRENVINILNDIVGQMRGNPILKIKCAEILKKMSKFADKPDMLNNPKKRNLVSELRETLRNINIQSYNDMLGEDYE